MLCPLLFGVEIKIVATIGQILRLKFTQSDFGWGSVPDATGGAYSAPSRPQLDLKGHTSNFREGRERERK